jgi:hypothetical protein
MTMRRIINAVVLVLALLPAVNVCAEENPEQAKAALTERVNKYWTARESRDVRTVYEMESASLPGGWLKPENAATVTGLPVRKVKLEEVTIDGEHAKVRMSGYVQVGQLGWIQQSLEDAWILIDGQWYHETRRPGYSPKQ